jgi:hypothetical protein
MATAYSGLLETRLGRLHGTTHVSTIFQFRPRLTAHAHLLYQVCIQLRINYDTVADKQTRQIWSSIFRHSTMTRIILLTLQTLYLGPNDAIYTSQSLPDTFEVFD